MFHCFKEDRQTFKINVHFYKCFNKSAFLDIVEFNNIRSDVVPTNIKDSETG